MEYPVRDFYIPTITYFTSMNKLTGSRRGMNYKLTPGERLLAQIWYGDFNLEHSELVTQTEFEMKQESMALLEQWLYEQYEQYLTTPQAHEYFQKLRRQY